MLSENEDDLGGIADLIFCDVAAYRATRRQFKKARVVVHRMISDKCLDRVGEILSGL